jgi:hypothetical protein
MAIPGAIRATALLRAKDRDPSKYFRYLNLGAVAY